MGGKNSKNEPKGKHEVKESKKETPTDIDSLDVNKSGIRLSKEVIDFGLTDQHCPIKEAVLDSVSIKNNSSKKIKFKFDPIPAELPCKLTFNPPSGNLPAKTKGKSAPSKKIEVKLILLQPEAINCRVNLRINGGETLFLTVKARPDLGVFGADPDTLDKVEDEDGFEVPEILVQMKNYLVEKDAFRQEGIFRLAGDANEMKILKDKMNETKSFEGIETDVNTVANLLKVWFRDLPVPILNALPSSTIAQSGDPKVVLEAYEELQEPQKTLLGWLLNLLKEVASKKKHNKMSAQNLAIVVAPNLYDPPGSDPMEGLVMSQKAVQFLHNLLLHELGEK